jgi:hypothetical protein
MFTAEDDTVAVGGRTTSRGMHIGRPHVAGQEMVPCEQRSLAYIATLKDARAVKGADIVRLTIEQLRVERT